jgi:ribonuclease T1
VFWSGHADCGRRGNRHAGTGSALRQLTGGWALTLAALAAAVAPLPAAQARPTQPDVGVVALDSLPPQAGTTYRLIRSGGPFPYEKDGSVFFNRERLLPPHARGYYREYTVPTPGARNRGARRIVCGGRQPTVPDTCFYTADHYASFARIADVDAR